MLRSFQAPPALAASPRKRPSIRNSLCYAICGGVLGFVAGAGALPDYRATVTLKGTYEPSSLSETSSEEALNSLVSALDIQRLIADASKSRVGTLESGRSTNPKLAASWSKLSTDHPEDRYTVMLGERRVSVRVRLDPRAGGLNLACDSRAPSLSQDYCASVVSAIVQSANSPKATVVSRSSRQLAAQMDQVQQQLQKLLDEPRTSGTFSRSATEAQFNPAESRVLALGDDFLAAKIGLLEQDLLAPHSDEPTERDLKSSVVPQEGMRHREDLLGITYLAEVERVSLGFKRFAQIIFLQREFTAEQQLLAKLSTAQPGAITIQVAQQTLARRDLLNVVDCLGCILGALAGAFVGLCPTSLKKESTSPPPPRLPVLDLPKLGNIPAAESLLSTFKPYSPAATGPQPFAPDMIPSADSIALKRWNDVFLGLASALTASVSKSDALMGKGGGKSFAITSANPGDGKTNITASLGLALSRLYFRVVLVDANFQSPRLHIVLPADERVGLRDILYSGVDITQLSASLLARPTSFEGLFIIPIGTGQRDDQEQPDTRLFPDLIRHLESLFDVVLIDTPPVRPDSATLQLTSAATAVILVIRAAAIADESIQTAASLVKEGGSGIIGYFLNGVEPQPNE